MMMMLLLLVDHGVHEVRKGCMSSAAAGYLGALVEGGWDLHAQERIVVQGVLGV